MFPRINSKDLALYVFVLVIFARILDYRVYQSFVLGRHRELTSVVGGAGSRVAQDIHPGACERAQGVSNYLI